MFNVRKQQRINLYQIEGLRIAEVQRKMGGVFFMFLPLFLDDD